MEIAKIEVPRLNAGVTKAIDRFLEELYENGNTKEAGLKMAESDMKNTQIRGLENLIVSTTRFSEIINYIKNQVGKNRTEWQTVGPILICQLEKIEAKAVEIAAEDLSVRMEVKLRLARGWARQVVAHFLYDAKEQGGKK